VQTASATAAGMASSQPQYASMTTTASAAGMAAVLAAPRRTVIAAAMQARYTDRNRVVGTVTIPVVVTSPAPYKVMSTSPAAATAARNPG
jgi:hypothetical protein